LFYLRGVAPPSVTTLDIYKGVVPFIALQVVATALLFAFPLIATWLPRAIGW
jgi:TRAP-type mannitol/chloroaromatic compound transport system permease large subunit